MDFILATPSCLTLLPGIFEVDAELTESLSARYSLAWRLRPILLRKSYPVCPAPRPLPLDPPGRGRRFPRRNTCDDVHFQRSWLSTFRRAPFRTIRQLWNCFSLDGALFSQVRKKKGRLRKNYSNVGFRSPSCISMRRVLFPDVKSLCISVHGIIRI